MARRALFFDVDGTLLDAHRGVPEIPDSVRAQLGRLHDAGDLLAVCTGRPLPMIDDSVLLPCFDAVVSSAGGVVSILGETVFSELLDKDCVYHVMAVLEQLGLEYMLQTAHHIYLDPRRDGPLYELFDDFIGAQIFTRSFDRDEVALRTIKVETMADEDELAALRAALDLVGYEARVMVDFHEDHYSFEVYSSKVSKATGIERVLAHFGIEVRDSFGIGDRANDLEMVDTCGTGVAMGNASLDLKAAADLVIAPIEEDGLARFLATLR